MSRRAEQISSTLHRALQQVLARGLQDPRYGGLVTVTGVKLAEDLKTADVFISVLPREREELTMHAIRHAGNHIRHEVSDLIALRQTPRLLFKLDRSLKKQAEVLEALAKAREESGENLGPEAGPAEAEGNNPPAPPAPQPPRTPSPGDSEGNGGQETAS